MAVHPICFPGMAPADYVRQCAALGAGRVGFLAPALLDDGALAAARTALAETGLSVESVTHVFCQGRLSGDRGQWRVARATLANLIDRAANLGARSIYMLTGGHGSEAWEEDAQHFCAAIAPCVEQARAAGVALALENAASLYADLHIAHTLADTVRLAEMADIGVCIELFFCWAEADLPQLFERAMPRCRLVQVSDYVPGGRSLPDRSVPGDGVIPLERLIGQLLAAGYTGAFDLELLGPRIDGEGAAAAVARAGGFLTELLDDLGA
jgi:sugar phosphate isomerase/epimerase